jgi:3-hydroxypropanoate dehydrogenase
VGPHGGQQQPGALAFVRSAEAKARLLACVSPGNVAKVQQAPVTVIVGMDLEFHHQLPKLFPHDRRAQPGSPASRPDPGASALRNSSLQGGYLILAARALGLDCGPMSGFDAAKVDAAFWAGTAVKTNFICTLGHGDPAKVRPRSPRLAFETACLACCDEPG